MTAVVLRSVLLLLLLVEVAVARRTLLVVAERQAEELALPAQHLLEVAAEGLVAYRISLSHQELLRLRSRVSAVSVHSVELVDPRSIVQEASVLPMVE
jgi:hypothetical protein